MPNYLFDVAVTAAIRIDAPTEAAARAHLRKMLNCADFTLGTGPTGTPVTSEMTMNDEPTVAEVDGVEPPMPDEQDLAPRGSEEIVGDTDGYRLFRGPTTIRLVRRSDGIEATWIGEKRMAEFASVFTGTIDVLDVLDVMDNWNATEKVGLEMEWRGEFSRPAIQIAA